MILTGDLRCDFEKVTAENVTLKDRILGYQEKIVGLNGSLKRAKCANELQKAFYEEQISEKDAIIKELKNRLEHELALKAHDGNSTGIPTSQTPINKQKVIPNSRVRSGKNKGGQFGHERHTLKPPTDEEINDVVVHEMDDEHVCPKCEGSKYTETGEYEAKYEYDIEINVIKRRHEFLVYCCLICDEEFRVPIDQKLKAQCQYGSTLKATALSLMNTGNMPINKVALFIAGITGQTLTPCEGYIAKLQARHAYALLDFMEDLRMVLITLALVYWDETVIMIDKNRACLRFYGDENIAFYTAHMHKDMESLDDDRVLSLLTSDTKTMHDHNRVNYNKKYSFENLECNQHLQRDLEKISIDTGHKWSDDMKALISGTIHERKDAISRGETEFPERYKQDFYENVETIISDGWHEYGSDIHPYCGAFEKNLLKRIKNYETNYFAWVENFELPTTNNLSERGLRGVKSHMKISGQFHSEKTARNYAVIKSYIETCRRNGINEILALNRLCKGNPYSVTEILTQNKV